MNNKTNTTNPKETMKWLQILMRILRMLMFWTQNENPPQPPLKGETTPTDEIPPSVETPLQLTASAAMSASKSASETSGHLFSTPLSRSQLSSWLRSESKALERKIDLLVLHCTDTRLDQDFTVEKLAACHKARGFGPYPGYHLYVRKDGTWYYTRPLRLKGCHVKDYNARSIGICYEGGHLPPGSKVKYGDTRTDAQREELRAVIALLHELFPNAKLVGHNQLNPKKACPCLSQAAMEEYKDPLGPPV